MTLYKIHPTTLWYRSFIESQITKGNILINTTKVGSDLITTFAMVGVGECELDRSDYVDWAWDKNLMYTRLAAEALDAGYRTYYDILCYITTD